MYKVIYLIFCSLPPSTEDVATLNKQLIFLNNLIVFCFR